MTSVTVDALLDYDVPQPAEVLLAVEAAQLPDQRLISDLLTVKGSTPLVNKGGIDGIGRRTWLQASGRLTIQYRAEVEILRAPMPLDGLGTAPHHELPDDAIAYLMPSRYCPSDQLENFVADSFSAQDMGALVHQMVDWIYSHISYVPGSSGYRATASDIFLQRQGVCRDFAHLLIAFARAADIPARMVSAYALGLDPPDFHAVAEVYLGGAWHLVDATRLVPETNIVRIGVGRDATDIGFMTIFGTATMIEQSVAVTRSANGLAG